VNFPHVGLPQDKKNYLMGSPRAKDWKSFTPRPK